MTRRKSASGPLASGTPTPAAAAADTPPSPAAAATPSGAVFESAAPFNSPTTTPPLKKGDIAKLVERFGGIRFGGEAMIPENIAKASMDDLVMRLNGNLEQHKLKKDTEKADGINQIVVVSRPALDHTAYFARLDETGLTTIKESGKMTVFSVPTAALANRMQSLGYVRVSCVYMTDDTQLPPRIARTTGAGSSREHRSKAPPGVVVAPALPDVSGLHETAAQQLVREWELHVELEDKYYSPCYLWSQHLREQQPKLNSDNFNQRAKVYVYLKRKHAADVGSLAAKMGDLKKMTNGWANEENKSPDEGGGKKRARTPWWAQAAEIARRAAEGEAESMMEE